MRVLGLLSLSLALTGCPGADTDSDADTDGGIADDGCPSGLQRTRSGGAVISQFTLNGVDRFLGLDASETYDGQPALCRSPDGTRALWILEQGDQPYGWIDVSAPSTGSAALNAVTGGYVTVNLFGDPDQPVFAGPGAWQQGVLTVNSVGSTFQVDISNAVGVSPSGDQLAFTASLGAETF